MNARPGKERSTKLRGIRVVRSKTVLNGSGGSAISYDRCISNGIHSLLYAGLRSAMSSFRARRMYHCARLLGLGGRTNVLDVGGTPELWELLPAELRPRVTLVNMPRAGVTG